MSFYAYYISTWPYKLDSSTARRAPFLYQKIALDKPFFVCVCIQKMVSKDEEREQALYNTVRESEYARQKKDQEVRRIQQKLLAVRTQNQQKLKQEQIKINQTETELEQMLMREKAELDKVRQELMEESAFWFLSLDVGELGNCVSRGKHAAETISLSISLSLSLIGVGGGGGGGNHPSFFICLIVSFFSLLRTFVFSFLFQHPHPHPFIQLPLSVSQSVSQSVCLSFSLSSEITLCG